jgi:hypothetical protein
MADIESLDKTSISDVSKDEAIEYLRQLRLSRRVPDKKKSVSTKKKIAQTKTASKISKDQAAELLKLLGGTN